MKRVAGDIIVETEYEGANVSCILTERGKVLVDVPYFPQDVMQWREIINEISSGDVAYLINTDHHFDHAIANGLFCNNIIGHEVAYEEMLRPGGTLLEDFMPNIETLDPAAAEKIKSYKLVPPTITFNKTLTLHMGDKTLEVIHLGGHTGATTVTYIPELKTLLTGDDVVNGGHPFMGQASIGEWEQALKAIRGMDIAHIIPGHGEVCDMDAVDNLLNYFKELRGMVEKAIKTGKSREEVSQEVDLINYFPFEEDAREFAVLTLQLGAERLYDEITAA